MAKLQIQTRRCISLTPEAYDAIRRAASARGVAMSAIIDAALGDLTGPRVAASLAVAKTAPPRRSGPPRPHTAARTFIAGGLIASDATGERRYTAIKPPSMAMRYPSLERRMLGDGVADALGFR